MRFSHFVYLAKKCSKKALWKFDKIILRGYIKRKEINKKEQKRIDRERFRIEHPEDYYNQQSEAIRHCFPIVGEQIYSIRDIFLAQFVDGVFKAYDIVIRILAVEQYYGKNEIGFHLYKKLQSLTGFDWIPRFSNLIKSYDEKGFDDANPIEVDNHLTIMDGAHRLALAIYHNNDIIPARIYKNNRDRAYDYNWFWEMNYTPKEIEIIQERTLELFNQCKYEYVGVIWPSAFHLRDQIIEDLNNYLTKGYCPPIQNDECSVVRYYDVDFDKLDFEGFLRAMYYTDVINEHGIRCKLQYIYDSVRKGSDAYSVRVFYITVLNPDICMNVKNNTAQSRQISRIKKVIRNRYKEKVNDYQYDIIMHISDNYIQSKFCQLALNIDKDINGLFNQLNNQYNYVIAKAFGRQSTKFPYYYYYYSDVDILVRSIDVRLIANDIEDWLQQKYNKCDEWIKVERIKDDNEHILIQVSLRGWRFFLIDIQTVSHFGMDNDFIDVCLENRSLSDNLLYILPPKYDMLIRAADLIEKPHKDWHRKYIAKYMYEYDEQLANSAFKSNLVKLSKVKQVVETIRNESYEFSKEPTK